LFLLYCGENYSFSTEPLKCLLILKGHAVAQFVEALPYKSEGRSSIPDDFIGNASRQPQTYVKRDAAVTVFDLLMMSGVSLETCRAISKRLNDKF
jgi:hypothetical protein